MDIAKKMLEVLHGFLDEQVLCVPTDRIRPYLEPAAGRLYAPPWDQFRALIDSSGVYVARSAAEGRDDLIQIVPVCVIEYGGRYLTNLRFEPGETLHDTLANWAGGHVRKEDREADGSVWDSVIRGLRREIFEELSLAQWPESPAEVGLVHTQETSRAGRHLGVVFRIRLEDAYTAAMLDGKTIRERPDRHVRTEWMSAEQLQSADKQKDWSLAIGQFLARG